MGETVFVVQVDFNSIGTVMANMALSATESSGEFAVLSATPDAANQNAGLVATARALKDPKYASIKLVDTVSGDDPSVVSHNRTLALVDKFPDLTLIIAPLPGTIHAVVGETGTDQGNDGHSSGEIWVIGVPVAFYGTRDAQKAGVAAIYQVPMFFPDLSVAENIFISHWRGQR